MEVVMKIDDLVPLSQYDKRVGKGRRHSESYKRLHQAGQAGQITMMQHVSSKRLLVSKSEADAYIASDLFARRQARDAGDDGRFSVMEDKLEKLCEAVSRLTAGVASATPDNHT